MTTTKTILYLARHGETVDNANHIMQGQTPGRLNDLGRAQARNLAIQLGCTYFDAFVSSDLQRAKDTCSIVATTHGQEVTTTPLLRERDWGSFTGKYLPDLKHAEWPQDIESTQDLKLRATRFLDFIRTHYSGKKVLAVGHGIINKAIQSVYYDKEMKDIAPMKNAELRILTL